MRRARLDDADAIAAVHVRAWHETYCDLLPPRVIAAKSIVDERRDRARLVLADAASFAHAALLDDVLVGFATGGTLRDPVPGFDGELRSIYLLQRAQRRGFGAALVRAVAADLRRSGLRAMAVRVLAENANARAFYEHLAARFVDDAPLAFIDGAPIHSTVYGWDDLAALARG